MCIIIELHHEKWCLRAYLSADAQISLHIWVVWPDLSVPVPELHNRWWAKALMQLSTCVDWSKSSHAQRLVLSWQVTVYCLGPCPIRGYCSPIGKPRNRRKASKSSPFGNKSEIFQCISHSGDLETELLINRSVYEPHTHPSMYMAHGVFGFINHFFFSYLLKKRDCGTLLELPQWVAWFATYTQTSL